MYAHSTHCFIEKSMNVIADTLSIASFYSSFLHEADTCPGLLPASATLGRSSACDRSPPATPWVCPQLPLCSDHWTPCADADPDLLTMQTCQTDLKKSYWLRQGSFTHGSPLLFFNRPFPACPMFRLSKYDADHRGIKCGHKCASSGTKHGNRQKEYSLLKARRPHSPLPGPRHR